jgi:hypothetical protein
VSDLNALYTTLGRPADLEFVVVEQRITPTATFKGISGLRKGEVSTRERVIGALLDGPLFEFGKTTVQRIVELE